MSLKKNNIALIGTFDIRNYGDLLFPYIAENQLKKRITNINLDYYSPNKKSWNPSFSLEINALKDLKDSMEDYSALFIGGGQLIGFDKAYPEPVEDSFDMPLDIWLNPVKSAIEQRKIVIWNCVGAFSDSIFPEEKKKEVKYIFEKSNLRAVRDQPSKQFLDLADINEEIKVIPDTAFSLPRIWPFEKKSIEYKNLIGNLGLNKSYVVIQADLFIQKHTPEIVSLLNQARLKNIILLPICACHGDDSSNWSFPNEFNILQSNWLSPLLTCEVIKNAKLFIGSSLHGSITAISYGVPSVFIGSFNAQDKKFEILKKFKRSFHLNEISKIIEACNEGNYVEKQAIDFADLLERYWDEAVLILLNNELDKLSQTVLAKDNELDKLSQTVLAKDNELDKLSQTVLAKDNYINYLNLRFDESNSQLIALQFERNNFGSKVGRFLTKIRSNIAPVGSYHGNFITLVLRIIVSLKDSGLKSTSKKIFGILQSQFLRKIRVFLKILTLKKNSHYLDDSLLLVNAEPHEFELWIKKNEPNKDELLKQIKIKFKYNPILSVVIPVYKISRKILEETIKTLEVQTYKNWQACIVWSDTDDHEGFEWLINRTRKDSRFATRFLEKNGGISKNSNESLKLAKGEFIVLLDHDDTLAPWAFFEIIKFLNKRPDADFIYSDKDSINSQGDIRLNALFKPSWSPEMMHSVNYLTHLNVIRASILKKIGGWRPSTDGAQDWDLFFRVAEVTSNIFRLTSTLYHWRIIPSSTSSGLAAKPYAASGQLKTQQDYLFRRKLMANVKPSPEGMFHIEWDVKNKSVDILVYQTSGIVELINTITKIKELNQKKIHNIYVVSSISSNINLEEFNSAFSNKIILFQLKHVNWKNALEVLPLKKIKSTLLILDGSFFNISNNLIEELCGWTSLHPDIAWTSAIALDTKSNEVLEVGRVVNKDDKKYVKSAPFFKGSSLYSYGWFGGLLWYRNMSACSPYAVAINTKDLFKIFSSEDYPKSNKDDFSKFCLLLSGKNKRGLINPFARIHFEKDPEQEWINDGFIFHNDPFFHPAFSQVNPLRL
jgi:glycosyltransferase involved in cell wall biosynthesis